MSINPRTWTEWGGVDGSVAYHFTGEIWCACLWDCRAAMMQAYGFAANDMMLRLVLDGMKLQPANPTFIQARDAILNADMAMFGGVNRYRLWTAFARRGLGGGASTANADSEDLAEAFDVYEGSDVGELPATAAVLNGVADSTITEISGDLAGAGDMFRITICDRDAFSATTVGLTTVNTQLFLFDLNGQPITFNNDAGPGITQSTITNQFVPSNGEYYLGMAGHGRVAFSAGGDIWLAAPATTERAPDGPGAGPSLPLVGWTGIGQGGTYRIRLTGVCPSTVGDIPLEPRALVAHGGPNPETHQFAASANIIYRVYVRPATLPASTGLAVTVDASPIGLGTLTLRDNGAAPDTAGGDNVFSAQATASASLAIGRYDLPFQVVDDQGRMVGGTMLLEVTDPSGACCISGTNCIFQTASQCAAQFGQYKGNTVACEAAPCIAGTESEPNFQVTTADNGTLSYTAFDGSWYHKGFSGAISGTTDFDYFGIGAMQVGDLVTATFSGEPSMRGTITGVDGSLWRQSTGGSVKFNLDSGPGEDALIWKFPIAVADNYVVRANRQYIDLGTYQIGLLLENAGTPPNTGGAFASETEPNNSVAAANNASSAWRPVQYVASMFGNLVPNDTDVFSYQFTAGDTVTIYCDGMARADTKIALLNSAESVRASDNASSFPGDDSLIVGYVVPSTGTYYIRVQGGGNVGTSGPYILSVFRSTTTPPTLFCPPDFNNSGGLSVQDIFDFLAAYFSGSITADYNDSGSLSVQDIFDFLASYFAGCT